MSLRYFTPSLLLTLASLALPSLAFAGSYDVTACQDSPTQSVNNSWQNMGASSAALSTSQSCSAGMTFDAGPNVTSVSGISANQTLQSGSNPAAGSEAYWRFTAPSTASITRIRYARYAGKLDSDYFAQFLRTNTGAVIDGACSIIHPAFWCRVGYDGTIGNPAASNVSKADISVPNASRIEFGVRCNAPAGSCGGSGTLAGTWASIYASTVTITENTAPTLSVDTSFGAWGDAAWLKGTQQVRVASATDATGIKALRLLVDGQQVAVDNRTCDFTYTVPCAAASGVTLSFDASQLAEGQHTMTVQAVDAANNVTTSAAKIITVDDAAPSTPSVASQSSANPATGSTWSINVAHPSTNGSDIAALRYRICHNGSCGGPQNAATTTSLSGIFAQAGTYEIRTWAVDAAGNENENIALSLNFSVADQGAQPTSPAPPTGPPALPTSPRAPAGNSSSTTVRPPAGSRSSTATVSITNNEADSDESSSSSAELKFKRLTRKGRTLTLQGSIADYLDDTTATITVKVGSKKLRFKRKLSGGRFVVRLKVASSTRLRGRVVVTITTPKIDDYAAARVSRTLRLR